MEGEPDALPESEGEEESGSDESGGAAESGPVGAAEGGMVVRHEIVAGLSGFGKICGRFSGCGERVALPRCCPGGPRRGTPKFDRVLGFGKILGRVSPSFYGPCL